MSKVKDILEDVDLDRVYLSVGIAMDLIAAGNEILKLLKAGEEVDEIKLIELIEVHNNAKEAARNELIASIKKRKEAKKV